MTNSSHKKAAISRLNFFLENNILNYKNVRNYDYGRNNRENTSNISRYITHRFLYEFDIIKKALERYDYSKIEKYIDEIFWRIYWKGYLENRPSIWEVYVNDLLTIEKDKNYYKAINGETNVVCFNDWVKEIKEDNYLHNHARMWFASIWIFTLKLPWQLGASFFLENLLDGDASSNTLSWRWVAGLHTRGKHYIARADNIKKFSNSRFLGENIDEKVFPIHENKEYKIKHLSYQTNKRISKTLVLFESDLCLTKILDMLKQYHKVYLLVLNNKNRKIKISDKVLNFKIELLNEIAITLKSAEIIDPDNFEKIIKEEDCIDVIYPFVGENLYFLNNLKKRYNILINYLIKVDDQISWQYCKKSFFHLKKNIKNILERDTSKDKPILYLN